MKIFRGLKNRGPQKNGVFKKPPKKESRAKKLLFPRKKGDSIQIKEKFPPPKTFLGKKPSLPASPHFKWGLIF
jgi:hypothetical protein